MKQLIIFLALILTFQTAIASSQYSPTLDKIENSLYGYTYSQDNDTSRLNRIEEKVYGKNSPNATTQSRVSKLKKDLSADLIGQEIQPKEDTFATDEDSILSEKEPVESAKMDYPIINELETQVFKKDFKEQNIKTRLSNLETKTFGKSYPDEDLSTRVDRLKAKIQPQSFLANKMDQQENDYYNDNVGKMNDNYHLDQYGAPFDYDSYNQRNNNNNSFQYPQDDDNGFYSSSSSSGANVFKPSRNLSLSTIEKNLYHTKFENENTSTRLNRIESSIFGTNFANDSDSERIARISSAINAQKTARRYDSNKFSQNMATAVQIGTLILMVLACIL